MQALIVRRGYTWAEAGRIVDQIAAANQGSIARRQLPLIMVLTIRGLVAGCALMSYGGYLLLDRSPLRLGLFRSAIGILVSGITMFSGSLIGVVEVLKAMDKE